MKKLGMTLAVCAALTIAVSKPAMADEASHKKATVDLLKLLKIDTQIGAMVDNMRESATAQLDAQNFPAELGQKFEKVINKQFDLINDEIGWDKISGEYISLYMEMFTEEEIVQLNNFYKTDLGQKLVDKMPELFARGMEIGQRRMMSKQVEIQQTMAEEWKNFEASLTEEERELLEKNLPAGYGL